MICDDLSPFKIRCYMYHSMAIIYEQNGEFSATQIAKSLGVDIKAVTGLIARLNQRAYAHKYRKTLANGGTYYVQFWKLSSHYQHAPYWRPDLVPANELCTIINASMMANSAQQPKIEIGCDNVSNSRAT